jgi:ribonuclease PH
MKRIDGRAATQLRPINFELDYIAYPEGSVLMDMGATRLLCNVSVESGVPKWFAGQGRRGGWITAEYSMLPRSTHSRMKREFLRRRARNQEIQRMIGRSLRAAFNLENLSEKSLIVDCDVLQADGGTRTAAISAGYVALALAIRRLIKSGELDDDVFRSPVAAVSAGICDGVPLLDLCYEEDSRADSDLNIVMNAELNIIELQATAEREAFDPAALEILIDMMREGVQAILEVQQAALAGSG